MTVIALVSCASRKQTQACPAKELYQSDLFRKARAYVERNQWPWYILSAQHGLLKPEQVIEPYDRTLKALSDEECRKWADDVFCQITDITTTPCCFKLFAGKAYWKYLIPQLQGYGCEVDILLDGLRIGEQLRWFKYQLAL